MACHGLVGNYQKDVLADKEKSSIQIIFLDMNKKTMKLVGYLEVIRLTHLLKDEGHCCIFEKTF